MEINNATRTYSELPPETQDWEENLHDLAYTANFIDTNPILEARQSHYGQIQNFVFPTQITSPGFLTIATLQGAFVAEFGLDPYSYSIHGIVNITHGELKGPPTDDRGGICDPPTQKLYRKGFRQTHLIHTLKTPTEVFLNPHKSQIADPQANPPYRLIKSATITIPELRPNPTNPFEQSLDLIDAVDSAAVRLESEGVDSPTSIGLFSYCGQLVMVADRGRSLCQTILTHLYDSKTASAQAAVREALRGNGRTFGELI